MHSGQGRVTVNNCGTVSGAVRLGDNTELFTTPSVFSLASATATAGGGAASTFTSTAPDVFNNLAGGLLRSSLVDLGSDGTLINSGSLVVGGEGTAASTRIIGNLSADSHSDIYIDLNSAAPGLNTDADLLSVSGTAALSGEIVVNTLELERSARRAAAAVRAGGRWPHHLGLVDSLGLRLRHRAVPRLAGAGRSTRSRLHRGLRRSRRARPGQS